MRQLFTVAVTLYGFLSHLICVTDCDHKTAYMMLRCLKTDQQRTLQHVKNVLNGCNSMGTWIQEVQATCLMYTPYLPCAWRGLTGSAKNRKINLWLVCWLIYLWLETLKSVAAQIRLWQTAKI